MISFRSFTLSRKFRFSCAVSILISMLIWLGSLRPVQDDYASLLDLRMYGFIGSMKKVWSAYGAKFSSAVPAYYANNLRLFKIQNFGLIMVAVVTFTLVMFSILLTLTRQAKRGGWARFDLVLIASILGIVSFGSILTPGLTAAYGFTWSATTHVWPIAFCICLYMLKDRIPTWMFLPAAFIISNSNITEGLTFELISIVCIFVSFRGHLKNDLLKSFLASAGGLIGIFLLLLSPGFSVRAKEAAVGISPNMVIAHIPRVSASLLGDYVTHPILFLGIFLGLYFGSERISIEFLAVCRKLFYFSAYFILVSIFADSIAYVSWYHLAGLYPFSFFTGFWIGHSIKNRLIRIGSGSPLLLRAAILCFALLIIFCGRDLVAFLERANHWDRNLHTNICAGVASKELSFIGTEIEYRPLKVGITDGLSRPWIADDYRTLLLIDIQSGQLNCTRKPLILGL